MSVLGLDHAMATTAMKRGIAVNASQQTLISVPMGATRKDARMIQNIVVASEYPLWIRQRLR